MERIKNIIINNKLEILILFIVLVVGTILRLYKIDEYMLFLGDEGRDATIVRRFLVKGDLMFIGPGTSVGNMYLGPLYYYMIAPFLLAFNFSPVGPSVMVALFGVATIYLIWFVTRVWFPSKKINWAGLIAAGLYAVSPVVIIQSRSSWNPNIMPFFALLTLFALWKVSFLQKWRWMIVVAVSFSVMLQSHYLGLILLPLIVVYWLKAFLVSLKDKSTKALSIKYSFITILIIILMMAPLIIFDARYSWRNFEAMKTFFLSGGSVGAEIVNFSQKVGELILLFITRLLTAREVLYAKYLLYFILFGVFTLLFIKREKYQGTKYFSLVMIVGWSLVVLMGLGMYKHVIWDHYFGIFFPAPFILFAVLSQEITKSYKLMGKVLVGLVVLVLFTINLKNAPLREKPNNQMQRAINVTNKIINESGGMPFNLAVIAEKNYEGAYQYYLEKEEAAIVMIDPLRAQETITQQLFVICEYDDKNKCQPTSNPKTEVANFGWSKIDKSWEMEGLILFRLVHNESGRP